MGEGLWTCVCECVFGGQEKLRINHLQTCGTCTVRGEEGRRDGGTEGGAGVCVCFQ